MAYIRPLSAIISVFDKAKLATISEGLIRHGIEILSTGGTFGALKKLGYSVKEISSYTNSPEIMDGRLKTLHPRIHGGLLGRREVDKEVMSEQGIKAIDILVVNFYPFERVVEENSHHFDKIIENIDIGGPAMVRSAAKNFSSVAVVVDTNDYELILDELDKYEGKIRLETRFYLAKKAFNLIARYDAAISNFFSSANWNEREIEEFPETVTIQYDAGIRMRYGENPHQQAAFYSEKASPEGSISSGNQIQGKQLSFNNIADADAAWTCVSSFERPACAIVKHGNPCGVSVSDDLCVAYLEAFSSDPTSAFGGVLGFNGEVDKRLAELVLEKQFVEVLLAPSFSDKALSVLSRKENVRLIKLSLFRPNEGNRDYKKVSGGLLIQDLDYSVGVGQDYKVVTERNPSNSEYEDLVFAWNVGKFVKSNAIVLARDAMTLGIGAGQTSRVMSLRIALLKAEDEAFSMQGSCMASDAFFPFRDSIDMAAAAGIKSVIQPGGSVRDDEIIKAANEAGLAMIFTGKRHFKH